MLALRKKKIICTGKTANFANETKIKMQNYATQKKVYLFLKQIYS